MVLPVSRQKTKKLTVNRQKRPTFSANRQKSSYQLAVKRFQCLSAAHLGLLALKEESF